MSKTSNKSKKIFFTSVKGGVAKTTTALNTSTELARLGYKVLTVDLDIQRSSAKIYEVRLDSLASEINDLKEKIDNEHEKTSHINPHLLSVWSKKLEASEKLQSLPFVVESINDEADLSVYLKTVEHNYDFIVFDSRCDISKSSAIKNINHADLVIFPYLDSVLDLGTTENIDLLIKENKAKNPQSKTKYRSLLVCENGISGTELDDLKSYFEAYCSESHPLLNSIIKKRKIYKDAILAGKGVCEVNPAPTSIKAQAEIEALVQEIIQLI